ncbi:MAG: carotenoid oxygenase family protein [Pseudomonadota bacterium]
MRTDTTVQGLNCLRSPEREHGFEDLNVPPGQIPKDLRGTLYRVGPGQFADKRGSYGHWFDGEGLLTALRFAEGRVSFACRMIKPHGADRPDYVKRGRIGRAPQGFARIVRSFLDPQAFVNTANTALLHWQGRLYALFEASLPTQIDPDTLETLGETDLDVIVRSFGAHPHIHAPSGAIINHGFRPPPHAGIDYYTLPPEGPAQHTHYVPISGRFPAHDVSVTDRHIVTVLSPLYLEVAQILTGGAVADCLDWRPGEQTDCIISPIGGGPHTVLKTNPMLYTHSVNAFEDGEIIVVQGLAARDATPVDWVSKVRRGCKSLAPQPAPVRLTEVQIDLAARRVEVDTLFETPAEFPAIDPRFAGRRHSVIYATGFRDDAAAYADFQDAILRFDLTSRTVEKVDFGAGHFVSEPIFIPAGAREGEGWLLCQTYDAHADTSYAVLLRAGETMEVIARFPLGQALAMSLHGLWVPG